MTQKNYGWTCGRGMNRQTDRQTEKWRDGQTDRQTDRWTRRTDGRTDEASFRVGILQLKHRAENNGETYLSNYSYKVIILVSQFFFDTIIL